MASVSPIASRRGSPSTLHVKVNSSRSNRSARSSAVSDSPIARNRASLHLDDFKRLVRETPKSALGEASANLDPRSRRLVDA